MKYESNIKDIINKITAVCVKLGGQQADTAMREIATSLRGSNLNRVFRDGLNVNETKIGNYSKGYIQIRKEAGYEDNSKVILKFTGKMMRELRMQQINDMWVIGFPKNYDSRNSYRDLIDKFQSKYGGIIWGISTTEEKKVQDIINRIMKIQA